MEGMQRCIGQPFNLVVVLHSRLVTRLNPEDELEIIPLPGMFKPKTETGKSGIIAASNSGRCILIIGE